MTGRSPAAALMLAAMLALAGCDNLADQPREKAYSAKTPPIHPPPGTGRREPPAPTPPVTLALLQRGRERFDIYCSPCHGRVGDGRGMIVQRGFPQPPTYHSDRLRAAPPEHFYAVITNGYGAMYSYAGRIAPADRWAIVAYIRALQQSQHTELAELPAAEQERLP